MAEKRMAEKSEIWKQEIHEPTPTDQRLRREVALKALRRLREIGEQLPPVDAAVVVRESRDLAGQGSR